jgi:hypothetical protein
MLRTLSLLDDVLVQMENSDSNLTYPPSVPGRGTNNSNIASTFLSVAKQVCARAWDACLV